MNVQPLCRPIASVEADWLALGIFADEAEPPSAVRGTPLGDAIGRLLAAKELPGLGGRRDPAARACRARRPARCSSSGSGPRERFDAGAAFAAGVAVGQAAGGQAEGHRRRGPARGGPSRPPSPRR